MKKALAFLVFLVSSLVANAQIMPVLQWARGMGGNSNVIGLSIATDLAGNVYTVGRFNGTVDFDPNAGTYNLTSAGGDDVFISKLDGDGVFLWAKRFGGTLGESGNSIAIDPLGNVYTTGRFIGAVDFDPNAGVYNLTSADNIYSDLFVSKLDASGNFVWAKVIGGSGHHDIGFSIALNPGGGIYVLDYNNVNLASQVILKLDALGNTIWMKAVGAGGAGAMVYGNSLAVDEVGNIYTTGRFKGKVDFNPSPSPQDTFKLISTNSENVFVTKLDSLGGFVWAKNMGGSLADNSLSIAVDLKGNVYTTGFFPAQPTSTQGLAYTTLIHLGLRMFL